MFHICFAADENYIKYTAVLITSIVKSTDTSRKFADFFSNNANGGGILILEIPRKTPPRRHCEAHAVSRGNLRA